MVRHGFQERTCSLAGLFWKGRAVAGLKPLHPVRIFVEGEENVDVRPRRLLPLRQRKEV